LTPYDNEIFPGSRLGCDQTEFRYLRLIKSLHPSSDCEVEFERVSEPV